VTAAKKALPALDAFATAIQNHVGVRRDTLVKIAADLSMVYQTKVILKTGVINESVLINRVTDWNRLAKQL
jgi:hypothetical protein